MADERTFDPKLDAEIRRRHPTAKPSDLPVAVTPCPEPPSPEDLIVPLSAAEYEVTQQQLLLLGTLVAEMPLEAFIRKADHAEAVAPFLDPTLYMRGGRNLGDIIRLAKAARELQKVVLDIQARTEARR